MRWQKEALVVSEFLSAHGINYSQATHCHTPLTMYPHSLTPLVGSKKVRLPHDLSNYNAMLYIHIPFCTARCTFCPFQIDVKRSVPELYAQGLIRQVEMLATQVQMPSQFNVHFGGGSPNLLSIGQLQRIVSTIQSVFRGSVEEIGMELHPEVANKNFDYIRALPDIGITRISFGLQTTDAAILHRTARHHKENVLDKVVLFAKELGLDVNVDVMCGGFFGETLEADKKTFEYIFGLEPDRVSPYQIQVQRGTAEERRFMRERSQYPNTEGIFRAKALLHELADIHGYHYLGEDFSRRSLPTFYQARKWSGRTAYLGLGAGAYSYIVDNVNCKGMLWWAPFDSAGYLRFINPGQLPIERLIKLTKEDVKTWSAIVNLKMGRTIPEIPGRLVGPIKELVRLGFVEEKREALCLTARGILIEDLIYAALISPALWQRFSAKRKDPAYDGRYDLFYDPETVLSFQKSLR